MRIMIKKSVVDLIAKIIGVFKVGVFKTGYKQTNALETAEGALYKLAGQLTSHTAARAKTRGSRLRSRSSAR